MKNIFTICGLIVLFSVILIGCGQTSSNQKELEHKEKELELKQKELELQERRFSNDSVNYRIDKANNISGGKEIGKIDLCKGNILNNAKAIMKFIKNKDFKEVSNYISPTKGLSIYSAHFSKIQVSGLWNDTTKYNFGSYGSSDEDEISTFQQFYRESLYARDFVNAKKIRMNEDLQGLNSTSYEIEKMYPKSVNVDFHFPGSPEWEYFDWYTVSMIFFNENDSWYLCYMYTKFYTP